MSALALLAIGSFANAGIVDPANSWATMMNGPAWITIAPGGYETFISPTNHTIDVYLRDSTNQPVEVLNIDVWLEAPDIIYCPGGVVADSGTFAPDPGHTTFSGAIRGGVDLGGDCLNAYVAVVAVGNIIESFDEDPEGANTMRMNSMDLTGDGNVSLSDFTKFKTDYYQKNPFTCETMGDAWCADYNESGAGGDGLCCTLADFVIFTQTYNISSCP